MVTKMMEMVRISGDIAVRIRLVVVWLWFMGWSNGKKIFWVMDGQLGYS